MREVHNVIDGAEILDEELNKFHMLIHKGMKGTIKSNQLEDYINLVELLRDASDIMEKIIVDDSSH